MPDWVDTLIQQMTDSSANGDSPADAIPSQDLSGGSDSFNPGRDSQAASSLFNAVFGDSPANSADAQSQDAPAFNPAKDSQNAYASGAAFSTQGDPNAGKSSAPSILQGLMKNASIKTTADGSVDWSDPKTITSMMKLIGAGGNLINVLMNHGLSQGSKTPAQLAASVKPASWGWNPQQQASMNAFTATPMGSNRTMIPAAMMPSPIVPGKGYAAGGSVDSPLATVPPMIPAGYSTSPNGTITPLQTTYGAGYNPNYQASMNDWINGTGALGAQHTGINNISDLENLSFANTGSYLSPQQMNQYWGQDPSAVASQLGWTNSGSNPTPLASAVQNTSAPPPAPRPIGTGIPKPGAPSGGGGGNVGAGGITMQQLQQARQNPGAIDPSSPLAQYASSGMGRGGNGARFDMGAARQAIFGNQQNQQGPSNQKGGGQSSPPIQSPGNGQSSMPNGVLVPFSSSSASYSAYGGNPTASLPVSTMTPQYTMKRGGHVPGYAHGGALGHVVAATGGQDDVVPARLAGGEFVWDADSVSALGDGNNAAGAKKLDTARQNLRKHKRSAPPDKIPPRAKSLDKYMKGDK